MRIAALVWTKDEAELVHRAVSHLRQIGADVVIGCDMGSTDGSAEVLQKLAAADDAVRFVAMSDTEDDDTWSQKALAWVCEAEVDWAIFLDADELVVPASGSLKQCAALGRADAVRVERFNVPLTEHGPALPDALEPERYEELLLVAEPTPPGEFWAAAEQGAESSWMMIRVAPRAIARPDAIARLATGGHDIVPADAETVRRLSADDVVIAHLPFTTRPRFKRKVANARQIFRHHEELFGDRHALHWRRWVALADQGKLDEEFDRMIFDDAALADLLSRGVVRSAADHFARHRAR